ncbi:hypothetical protein [Eisenbergiella porci]|uniref:hypothetical protein n=1 Tax=Eisenbergiella porci TaxID=2652274 RepID=UPI002A829CB5|nr:hypothetical protein [Eisenbergiella porci]
MTVKEYAARFNLSVNGLCEVTGLSRQGLNDILVKGYPLKNKSRQQDVVLNLLSYAQQKKMEKKAEADNEYKERSELIYMFYNERTK